MTTQTIDTFETLNLESFVTVEGGVVTFMSLLFYRLQIYNKIHSLR